MALRHMRIFAEVYRTRNVTHPGRRHDPPPCGGLALGKLPHGLYAAVHHPLPQRRRGSGKAVNF